MSTAPATQAGKAVALRALHDRTEPFVIANAWDAASARMLETTGFLALATSSAAAAEVVGKRDGQLTRDEKMAHIRMLVGVSALPISADLGNGFGVSPEDCAETIRLAAAAGAVGGSIEDSTGGSDGPPIFDFELSVARVAAAVEAARRLPFPFTVTARSENFFQGVPDLDDTIRRLQAYERAGADVLFAPLLPDLDAVRRVCASVSKPVNFMNGVPGKSYSLAALGEAGVRRVSVATSLFRHAMKAARQAAEEIRDHGTFGYIDRG
ncbi:isocitrate lyase/PEP mutase family protein [Roseateles chitosanitabidus]|jgi:2-methylisocitrate lyase-like PEP mutase family enzyme|uniref:isocitrate lyase/PEP mutase family protein n=1 Tax=Roseateles chitosanitabidus TaxID=65048 RepID=UPI00083287CB|nr:isocitrate lyase/phosphoenolpyruvate mutase family protein [Roseateles chitosanitabidus]MBO9685994.1 isocitrate lyase/phosphoenolpyruvate mutase family protein [Roseateles chitosanitabidus]